MFKLPVLPYKNDELAPFISKETLEFHYGKHHKTYVDNLNKLIENTPHAKATLEVIVQEASGPLYNNAAQSWNHTFYWLGLTKSSSRPHAEPIGSLKEQIIKDFTSVQGFKDAYKDNIIKVFGSGWTWLVKDAASNKLSFLNTTNADGPLKTSSVIPIHVCDVWEHAYYIDYRNVRATYFDQFWNIVDWDFCEKNFNSSKPLNLSPLMS